MNAPLTLVNKETGELVEITEAEVDASIARVVQHAESIWDEWAWQVENQTWLIKGYASWDEMRRGEYGALTSVSAPRAERPELVARFRSAGLTQKETADTLGVSQKTVSNHDHYDGVMGRPRLSSSTKSDTLDRAPAQEYAPCDDPGADEREGMHWGAVNPKPGEPAGCSHVAPQLAPTKPPRNLYAVPLDPEAEARNKAEADHRAAIDRYAGSVRAFLAAYGYARTIALGDPLADEVLEALEPVYRDQFLTISKEIQTWPTI